MPAVFLLLFLQLVPEASPSPPGTECSRNFTAPQGFITSPTHPGAFSPDHPHNLTCTFTIVAPEISDIVLKFNNFSMKPDGFNLDPNDRKPTTILCQAHGIEIWDGPPGVGIHIGTYCGSTAPGQVISRSGILSMIITAGTRISEQGHLAQYTIQERTPPPTGPGYSCGGGLDVESGGYFTSPGYPFDYLPSERCVWVITAQEPDQKILLTFNAYFHLEDKDCKHDYVEVYNGGTELSPLVGRFCGIVAPSPIKSSGNQLLIKFVSNDEIQDSGFSAQYKVLQPGLNCSRNFTAPQGLITTPNFPENYPNNMECVLMILAPPGAQILLEFDSFIMEDDSTCQSDRLEIWDGPPGVGVHVGQYCGYNSPNRIFAQSGVMSLIISSDQSSTKEGFSAKYTISQ
ncbi:neuropilin-1a-like [Echeneis naucrates]|uniref:neuropilin-1a-like n=1 Tax=Echeneis naucrates TaxID=173247 RepID=UPI00111336CB|nr:neuropilin-1a-like [Echeneis naucrates]